MYNSVVPSCPSSVVRKSVARCTHECHALRMVKGQKISNTWRTVLSLWVRHLARGCPDLTVYKVKAVTKMARLRVLSRGSGQEVDWVSSVLADGRKLPAFQQGTRSQGGREVGGSRKERVSVFFTEPFPVFFCYHLELLSALCILTAFACSTVCLSVKISASSIRLCPRGGHKAGLAHSWASGTQHCVQCAQWYWEGGPIKKSREDEIKQKTFLESRKAVCMLLYRKKKKGRRRERGMIGTL